MKHSPASMKAHHLRHAAPFVEAVADAAREGPDKRLTYSTDRFSPPAAPSNPFAEPVSSFPPPDPHPVLAPAPASAKVPGLPSSGDGADSDPV